MEYLVLDEADRLLDLGFEPDVRWIIEKTSQTNRQTAMVSATWPQAVRSLASEFLSDPVLLRVGQNGGSLSFHVEEGMLQANQRVELNVEVCICAYLEMSLIKLGEDFISTNFFIDCIILFRSLALSISHDFYTSLDVTRIC